MYVHIDGQPKPYLWIVIHDRYYVAGTSDTLDNQHIHALKGSSNIIWDSTWSYACMSWSIVILCCMICLLIVVNSSHCYPRPRCMGYRPDRTNNICRRIPSLLELGRRLPMSLHLVSTRLSNGLNRHVLMRYLFYHRQFASATTLVSGTVQISCPTNSWEEVGGNTDEGPGELEIIISTGHFWF